MEAPPKKIGKYDIIAPLGKGAMGVVYKAYDPGIGRHVALKTVQLSLLEAHDSEVARRFQREAQAAGNLNHPNIVAIYEFGEDAGRAFIAMEYVEGRTLADLFNEGHKFIISEIHRILSGVLAALDYSHHMGVIHRDIKPGNIMMDNAGTVKVMDFGVARIESSNLTQVGTIIGTPRYMSPEQLLGDSGDPRSDLYSTGILLYELLTCERAFDGSSFVSVSYKVIHSDLLPPSLLRPTVPDVWDELLAKACAKQADHRYQSADKFLADLEQSLLPRKEVHEDSFHAPDATTQRISEPSPSSRPDDGRKAPPLKKKGRKMIPVMILMAIIVSIALSIWKMRHQSETIAPVAKSPPGKTFKDCDACPEMVVLPAGDFLQGSADTDENGDANESPEHLVSVDYTLAVSRYEITRGEFARFVEEIGHQGGGCSTYNGSWEMDPERSWQSPGFEQNDRHPATCISWNDAQAYIQWLSKKTDQEYRLLSASEWEYAATSGQEKTKGLVPLPSPDCDSANVADQSTETTYPGWDIVQCRDNFVHTAPVGSFKANAFGLHDMMGNVFEWVTDCWNISYQGAPKDGSPWAGGDCNLRVLRGGSWFTSPDYLRATFRNRFDPGYRSSSFGFRVARSP